MLINLSRIKSNQNLFIPKAGFTIVELLIVIVVIGILATISIVAYNGIQSRARISAVYTDMSNFKKKVELYKADHGKYPTTTSELTSSNLSISTTSNYELRNGYSNFYYCVDVANDQFGLGVRIAGATPLSHYISSTSNTKSVPGVISSSITCNSLGLLGTSSADGAYSASGISGSGAAANWLKASS